MNTKRERFEKVAAKRTQKIIALLDLLGNCSNKNNYEYNEKDVDKMFRIIRNKIKQNELLFKQRIKKMEFKF
ncbi:MAG: hypothetical protein PHV30_04410 [Candidatus Margulisbacteria bacterium]|nr:hypothetical protein [Candidatus Margulisiibacteriota bacterium]